MELWPEFHRLQGCKRLQICQMFLGHIPHLYNEIALSFYSPRLENILALWCVLNQRKYLFVNFNIKRLNFFMGINLC